MSSSQSLWRPITLTKVSGLTPVLISAPSDIKKCGFCCGNAFEDEDDAAWIDLPCFDAQCQPCARLWHVLKSPVCVTCYGHFICPRLDLNNPDTIYPRLLVKANHTIQLQSPSDWQIESAPGHHSGYVEVRGAYIRSADDTFPHPGCPMQEEEIEVTATSEASDEKLREALTMLNNRFDTNFSIRDIEEEIPLADLRKYTQPQLESKLKQFYAENVDYDAEDESSQLPDGGNLKDGMTQQDEESAKTATHSCSECPRTFQSANNLAKHTEAHKCSICGKNFKNTVSRRRHEKRHRETDSERVERLRKARVTREQRRASREL